MVRQARIGWLAAAISRTAQGRLLALLHIGRKPELRAGIDACTFLGASTGKIGITPIFASLYRSYSTGTDGASDTTHTADSWSRALRHRPAYFRRDDHGRGR
jgi:hypothetical protein